MAIFWRTVWFEVKVMAIFWWTSQLWQTCGL